MKSPFPGMDPYIEECGLWADFHDDFINEIKRALAAAAPARYFVQTGERSYIVLADEDGKDRKRFVPDVEVATSSQRDAGEAKAESTAVADPETAGAVTMRPFIDEHFRENFIEIYEADPEVRLVTCLEVLSPSNKRRGTEGWDVYLRKRNALLLGAANFVEIDLLRGGQRMPMIDPWPKSPYYILYCRKRRAPNCTVLPAGYRQPLPEVPVPLADPDPDIRLTLQPMVEAVYQRSRYALRINYTRPLTPSLGAEDAAWLAEQMRARQPAP
ncbi:MAG TPA: DUF4058 family protein [Gemmataceae bacterium]|nr:DUF4058 family protein [Gemmataceae bacterium]